MRVGRNQITGEGEIYLDSEECEIYLDSEECEMMKEIVRGAHLPTKRAFYKIISEL